MRNLDEIKCFLNDNQLAINVEKTSLTELMIHQKKSKTPGDPPSLLVRKQSGEDKEIKDSSYTRVLGANLQSNLTWNTHLEVGNKALLPSVRQQLGRLRHLGNLIPRKSRENLARGMILSRLNYLMPLWGGAANSLIRKAQTTLNTTARWVTGLPRRTRISKLMDKTGWYSIREQIRISTALQSWKLYNLNRPERLTQSLEINRDDDTMTPRRPRLLVTARCFKWRACQEWNNLPPSLRWEKSLPRFKSKIRRLVKEDRTRPPDPDLQQT